MIEPVKDAYGPEADRSHLADYLELLALSGQVLRQAELADYLSENRWSLRSRELFYTASEPSVAGQPTEDENEGGAGAIPTEVDAADIFAFLDQRAEALGDCYPFAVRESALVVVDPLGDQHSPYLALLAVTAAHHYAVNTPTLPERVFEQMVAQVMSARGMRTIDTGAAGRGGGDFRDLVDCVGKAIGLRTIPDASPSRTHANEEGVDTVSHFAWGDDRAGHWTFIGQATCARSNEWHRKLKEPDPRQWGPLLGSVVEPLPYLAVPHHVEDAHLLHLSQTTGRLVLDRIRLAKHMGSLSPDQSDLLAAVRAMDVFNPALG